jgi:hypothetical protein
MLMIPADHFHMKVFDSAALEDLYARASIAFVSCIEDADSEFLNTEVSIPLSDIITKKGSIKVQFIGSDIRRYVTEAKLTLHTPSGEELGYYCLQEDENGNFVDEYLVFE